jgi:rhamnosyl/mannosyltransferase
MKILMVISEAPPVKSGVSRVAEKLSKGLSRRGHRTDVLSLRDIPRWEKGEMRFSSMPLRLPSLRERFRQYDVIHLHGPVPTFSDVFLLWGLRGLGTQRPKLVYTHHAPVDLGLFAMRPLILLYNKLQERLARGADHVVATTPSYGRRLGRFVPAARLSVIPWGVDYERFAEPVRQNGKFTVVYLGQIRPYKGLPVLLDASDGLRDTRLWVIGDGHFAKQCRQQAAQLTLPDITFWGRLSDERMIDLLKQAHALVLPSVTRSEAFGIALLEGMSAGLVPIASHLPGVADLVGNEGLTFRPGDAGALRELLIRLRNDPDLRVHLAGLAQAKARLYSWERVVFGYERVFDRLSESGLNYSRAQSEVPAVSTLRTSSDFVIPDRSRS